MPGDKVKDTSVIPEGPYCYDENHVCPYWSRNHRYPKQYNGYCSYLGKGDWELEKEMVLISGQTGEKNTGDELPFPVSLLWDQCKECGINFDWEDEPCGSCCNETGACKKKQ